MPGFEEVASYFDLFSTDEWESLDFGSWDSPDPNDFRSLPGVAAIDGEGCAASSQAAPGGNPSDEDPIHLEFIHEVSWRSRQLDDGTTEYVLECDICDEIGAAEDYEEADVIAQQHRRVTSESWEVTR